MKTTPLKNGRFAPPAVICRALLSWLIAATAEYLLLSQPWKDLQTLDGLAAMKPLRVLLIAVLCFGALTVLHFPKLERWLLVGTWCALAGAGTYYNFSWAFLAINGLVALILLGYAVHGWNGTALPTSPNHEKGGRLWRWVIVIAGVCFFLFVAIWTVCRVLSFSTPTFDFGIFSQMFHSMKTTGLPATTVERDGLLSHFHVHMSPIYYLLLPFYSLFPYPATLQVLQAAVMASAVIPLWKIGKDRGLSPIVRCMVCVLLLVYPAYAGGASYDIHENAFLTPLILWLFYSLDRKNLLLTGIFGILVLCVKEDAAVYAAVIALYYLVLGLLHRDGKTALMGGGLAVLAVAWFLAVTGYLAQVGDGVMTYRYSNFMYDGSGSLMSVIKAVLLSPLKALYECVDAEKLSYIGLTILPLAALPLFTRRYERYLLLIPYVLINLMSDYQYQHSIMFQYNFGSLACLFYIVVVNLTDIRPHVVKIILAVTAVCISTFCFANKIQPTAKLYMEKYDRHQASYQQVADTLDLIPEGASVAATTFYTTHLSDRAVLYDIQYASWEHIVSCEYIALDCDYERAYEDYAFDGGNGFDALCYLLAEEGYGFYAQLDDELIILQKE